MALTVMQEKFVNEYLIDFNATRAAERAGYAGNKNALAVMGHTLLRNTKISELIKARLDSAMPADEVIVRLAEHARADIGDFLSVAPDGETALDLTGNPNTRLIKKITQRRTIRTVKDTVTEDVVLTLELHDAQAALVHIGKHHKLFTEGPRGSEDDPFHMKHIHEFSDIELARIAAGGSGGTPKP